MSSIRTLFCTQGLRGRLRVFIINLLLMVILVLTVVMVLLTKQHIKKNYRYELLNIVDMQQKVIDKWFNERETDINFLASSEVVSALKIDEMKTLFESFTATQSEFYYINFIDLKGISQVDSTFLPGKDYRQAVFFRESIDGLDGFSRVHMDKHTQTPAIIFSSAVYNKNSEVIGVITGGVRLSSIQAIIEEFHFGESGETFIVNDKNKLLTQRRFEQSNNILNTVPSNFNNEDFYINYAGQSVLGAVVTSNFKRWFIVAQITEAEIYKLFNQFLITIAVFITGLVILLLPLIFRFASIIEQPLQQLLHGSRKIKEGNYGYLINSEKMHNATLEIKELSESFNSMSLELKQVIEELIHNSTIDMLSKLFNRREFFSRSVEKYQHCQKSAKSIAIMMIDIDHFKRVNDNYGHKTGDETIEKVSNVIKTSVSEDDIVGRYGGEEFIVFLSDIDKQAVFSLAERIRHKIATQSMGNEVQSFHCTGSIGVRFYPQINSNLQLNEIIDQADKALYKAKENGRNQTIIVSGE